MGGTPSPPSPPFVSPAQPLLPFSPWEHAHTACLPPPAAPTSVLFGNERDDSPQDLPLWRPAEPHRLLPDFMGHQPVKVDTRFEVGQPGWALPGSRFGMVLGTIREALSGMVHFWPGLTCSCFPSLFHHKAAGDGAQKGETSQGISSPCPKTSPGEGASAQPEEDGASLASPGDLTWVSPPCGLAKHPVAAGRAQVALGAAEHMAEHSQLKTQMAPGSELLLRQGGNSPWRYLSSATSQQDSKGHQHLISRIWLDPHEHPESYIHI